MDIIDSIVSKLNGIKKEDIEKVIEFHGCLSPGVLIGIFMFDLAKRILNIDENDRIYVTCETYNCIPDAFQILGKCTTGNKRLKVIDTGKMAVTVNNGVEKEKSSKALELSLII